MKKIINDPAAFVDEVVDGLLLAHPDQLRAVTEDRRALVRSDAGKEGIVGIVTGGGSGHLPLFLGYVGQGLASGVAVGNVFSSPSSEQILAATLASDGGAGVLYLYGNYGGDIYNFDIAGDLAAARGVQTKTVLGVDDVTSAPIEKRDSRRGVAGLFFAYKTAGAAAAAGRSLDEVAHIAQHTVNNTLTMGVGLSPTILPAAGEPTFTLDEGEMEIGIGIHGEPGHHRGPIETADEIADRFVGEILGELNPGAGDRVAVLVNGLGATPLEELYVIYRRVHQRLAEIDVTIEHKFIGEYATSLEMAGASVSICHLDDELSELIAAPAQSPFFQNRSSEVVVAAETQTRVVEPAPAAAEIRRGAGPERQLVIEVATAMVEHEAELRELDAAIGDGDLGLTVRAGSQAIASAVAALPEDAHSQAIWFAAGKAFAAANPSTFAALLGGGMLAGATALTADEPTRDDYVRALSAMQQRIQNRGGARVGDKTMVDVLDAVAEALEQGGTIDDCCTAAERVVDEQTTKVNLRGRAAWLGARTAGHRDPGSVAILRMLQEARKVLSR